MASRALLHLSRPVLKQAILPSTVRSYATAPVKPATYTKPVYRAASTSSTVSQAEIDEELLAGTSTPRESVPSSATLRATAPEANTVFPEQGTAHPPMAATESPADAPANMGDSPLDWSRSYHGLGSQPFPKEVNAVLLAPVDPLDVEIKPDGLIYLPEIKYRRALNRAFGPGGWGLAPRSETNVGPRIVSREYALVCFGRLVAIARGEQEYFDPSGIPTATEACKSNALMRCCKDLGVASELWDPRFIREFKAKHAVEVFAEHGPTKKKKKLWRRKDQPKFDFPWKE